MPYPYPLVPPQCDRAVQRTQRPDRVAGGQRDPATGTFGEPLDPSAVQLLTLGQRQAP